MTTVCQLCGKALVIDDELMDRARAPFLGDPVALAAMHHREQKLLKMVCHTGCLNRREQEKKNSMREQRSARWNRVLPEAFRETVFDQIPFEAKKEVLDAIAEGHSVILIGPTGRGKTRLIWEACRPLFMAGRSTVIHTHRGLKSELLKLTDQGPHWVPALLEKMKGCDVCFLDDLGKANMVGNDGKGMQNEEFITELIDYRTSHKKQTLLTAEMVGSQLEAKMSERGPSFVRRLREFFKQFTG